MRKQSRISLLHVEMSQKLVGLRKKTRKKDKKYLWDVPMLPLPPLMVQRKPSSVEDYGT